MSDIREQRYHGTCSIFYVFKLFCKSSVFSDVTDKSVSDTWNHLLAECGYDCRTERW